MTDLTPAQPQPSWLETFNPDHPRGPFRCAVFDFDGTLSLLRGNWQGLMVPMMVETLLVTGSGESREALTDIVEEFVTRLTGQPTIQQMRAMADEVLRRGQPRPDPALYLARYLDQLISRTEARIEAVQAGATPTGELLVPGTLPLLERLQAAGWILAIVSGTELPHVVREAGVLKIDHFVGPRIFGPASSNAPFSKESTMRQLMTEYDLAGPEIVAIGDGPAEILAAKAIGGLALGVASDEVSMSGHINSLKRDHLLRSGADVIIPDYRNLPAILSLLKTEN